MRRGSGNGSEETQRQSRAGFAGRQESESRSEDTEPARRGLSRFLIPTRAEAAPPGLRDGLNDGRPREPIRPTHPRGDSASAVADASRAVGHDANVASPAVRALADRGRRPPVAGTGHVRDRSIRRPGMARHCPVRDVECRPARGPGDRTAVDVPRTQRPHVCATSRRARRVFLQPRRRQPPGRRRPRAASFTCRISGQT